MSGIKWYKILNNVTLQVAVVQMLSGCELNPHY